MPFFFFPVATGSAVPSITVVGASQVLAIISAALEELNVYQPGEAPSGEDTTSVLGKLNRILDNWNAERDAIYSLSPASYVLHPNLNPHTIGPTSATFDVPQRPVSIDNASLELTTSTPSTFAPITIRDKDWYYDLTVPDITSSIPTDLYYESGWPNGSIFLYPVPSVAYTLQLLTRTVLGQVVATDTITLPPGYLDLVILELADASQSLFPSNPLSARSVTRLIEARARVYGNNGPSIPRLVTASPGLSRGGRGSGTYDWRTGLGN